MKHFQYLWYVLRHKWFVLLAGWKIGASVWLLLTHDLSKFLPSEWFAYVDYFYDKQKINDRTMQAFSEFGCAGAAPWGYFPEDQFAISWCLHQHRNPHHWQYWYVVYDDGRKFPVGVPEKYLREMVADWAGAGRAISGKWEVREWYLKNKEKILVQDEDHARIIELLDKLEGK